MRLLLLLLLLMNLAVFAVLQWGGNITARPDLPSPPLQPQRITLVGEPRTAPSPAGPERASPNVAAPAAAPGSGAAANDTICMRWGPIPPAQIERAVTALAPLQLGERVIQIAQGVPRGPYWVYFPPLTSREEADNKAAELANLGVKDLAVIRPSGQWQNAISLGLYARLSVAEARLAELRNKGVQEARIDARGKIPIIFALRDLDPTEQDQMAQLQQAFGDTQLNQVSCAQINAP